MNLLTMGNAFCVAVNLITKLVGFRRVKVGSCCFTGAWVILPQRKLKAVPIPFLCLKYPL
jgi:hypothetical protein